ncbi:HNH endonuclease [Pseudofrankia sp. DC12]|uniref:HNH endonuclease n=1 Tax=Pseudofrankia sp. DC12 TaxID=683315 RepID=UPI0005F7A186|nr:HNH endonuclease [Pseudofrankia sp. DC12]
MPFKIVPRDSASDEGSGETVARPRYVKWFQLGAGTLRAVLRERRLEDRLPSGEDWYVCPLCLDSMFTVEELDTGELTVEHVPPRSLGGHAMVLTCRRCNNYAGSRWDAQAYRRRQFHEYLTGQSGRAETVTLDIGGVITRAELHLTGTSGFLIAETPKINNPANLAASAAHLDARAAAR